MAKMRIERVNSEIQKVVAGVINNELNDPRLDGFMVTVNKVETSQDLFFCRIFISIFPNKETDDVINALKHSLSYIRKRVSKMLLLRHTPELAIVVDNGAEYFQEINTILKKITKD